MYLNLLEIAIYKHLFRLSIFIIAGKNRERSLFSFHIARYEKDEAIYLCINILFMRFIFREDEWVCKMVIKEITNIKAFIADLKNNEFLIDYFIIKKNGKTYIIVQDYYFD